MLCFMTLVHYDMEKKNQYTPEIPSIYPVIHGVYLDTVIHPVTVGTT